VLSGPVEAIEEVARALSQEGQACRRLPTEHAFHSAMMTPLVEPLRDLLRKLPLRPPVLPVLSSVTGTWLGDEEATSPAYWAQHLCRTIRFADQVGAVWQLPDPLLIEMGPGQTLGRLALQCPRRPADALTSVVQTLPGQFESRSELEVFLSALGQIWASGRDINRHQLVPD
jgi:acyl transferase domain-containing protein